MEFAGLQGGEQQRGVDVGLDDEVAELGRHDAVFLVSRGYNIVGIIVVFSSIGVWSIGFPFLENRA